MAASLQTPQHLDTGMNKNRILAFDVLKAIAIILVVLYHLKLTPFGYLGVDIFLVINGYFIAGHFRKLQTINSGIDFLVSRITRLWPIVIISSVFCLVWGAVLLLPFSYRGLLMEIIATNFFANNILKYLTTKDYWATSNDISFLMHTWYLGILMQFYVVITIILIVFKKLLPGGKDKTGVIILICLIVSLALYLLPGIGHSSKFYHVPFRAFEFCLGALAALYFKDKPSKQSPRIHNLLCICAFVMISVGILFEIFPLNQINVITTCLFTSVILISIPHISPIAKTIFHNQYIAIIGKASLSIYIWHQIILGIYRTHISAETSTWHIVIQICLIGMVSIISYLYIEKIVSKLISRKEATKQLLICLAAVTPIIGISYYIYLQAGVLRDVPELNVKKGHVDPRAHIAYNEKVHQYNTSFSQPDKLHWFIVGDSFGRDWVNILREAGVEREVELSYSTGYCETRMKQADMIFRTLGTVPEWHERTTQEFLTCIHQFGISQDKALLIGGKKFGDINYIYSRRFFRVYPDVSNTTKVEEKYFEYNDYIKKAYGDMFIDLLSPVATENHEIRVFSNDKKFISHDCVHLTKAGAMHYAEILQDIIWKLVEKSKQHKGNSQ